jgi:hypothetical protein
MICNYVFTFVSLASVLSAAYKTPQAKIKTIYVEIVIHNSDFERH